MQQEKTVLQREELPYERFLRFGPQNLTESELLAIILRTGTKDCSAVELARNVLCETKPYGQGLVGLHSVPLEELTKVKGIGQVKAVKLKCIAELSLRMSMTSAKVGMCFLRAEHVAAYYMEQMRHRKTECVMVVSLDARGRLLRDKILTEGSVKMSLISPREIFLEALDAEAVSIILIHNHPSGDPTPSKADIRLTDTVREASKVIDIPLLDHIVIGDRKYVSFAAKNWYEQ